LLHCVHLRVSNPDKSGPENPGKVYCTKFSEHAFSLAGLSVEHNTLVCTKLDNASVVDLTDAMSSLCRESGQMLIDSEAVETLIGLSDGDARCALNGLEFVINARLAAGYSSNKRHVISDSDVRSGLVRSHVVYDRLGTFSALTSSVQKVELVLVVFRQTAVSIKFERFSL